MDRLGTQENTEQYREITHHGVLPVHVLPSGTRLLYTTNRMFTFLHMR